jgi:hypothetical protein
MDLLSCGQTTPNEADSNLESQKLGLMEPWLRGNPILKN